MNPDTQHNPVRRLFDAASTLAPEARPAFLDQHCTDPIVRRQVEQLLAAVDSGSGTDDNAERTHAAPDGQAAPEALPILPGFELLRELGRGGMGVVYLAREVRLDRLVAIKVGRFQGLPDGATARRRFRTEAEAMARLQHNHIVQIFRTDEANGEPFVVMEYCPGGTLDRQINGMPREPAWSAGLVEVLARAVAAAHAQQVLHRDLKPANVLLAADGRPKIADFGLARKLDEAGLTHSGDIVGTPAYMAPEQAGGDTANIGAATDVYALGAVLYTLLTGRPPFQSPSVVDTLLRVRHQEPVSPRRLQPKVPRDLETICLKCLQKQPQSRYASATALADDLARFMAGRPIQARPVSTAERSWRWVKREPVKSGFAAFALVALLTLGIVYAVYSRHLEKAETARDEGDQKTKVAEQERDRRTIEAEKERKEKELAKGKEQQAKLDADKQKTEGHLDTALKLCEKGNLTDGLLWLARALQECPAEAPELDAVIRVNLAGWARVRGGLRGRLAPPNGVWTVAFAPDGKTAVVGTARVRGSNSDALLLWDTASGQVRGKPLAHEANLSAFAFSPDSKLLATADLTGNITLWDVATGERMGKPGRHKQNVTALAFSPKGDQIVTGSWDRTARVWKVPSGEEVAPALEHEGQVTAVAFSPDGTRLLTGDGGKNFAACLWDASNGKQLARMAHESLIGPVGFLPDGKTPFTVCLGKVRRWNPDTGKPLGPPLTEKMYGRRLAFNPAGNLMAGGASGDVIVWDLVTNNPAFSVKFKDTPDAIAFRPDGSALLTASRQQMRLWSAATGEPLGPALESGSNISGVMEFGDVAFPAAIAPDGSAAATCDARYFVNGNEARLFFPPASALAGPALQYRSMVEAIYFLPDRKTCVVDAGQARLYDLPARTPRGEPMQTGGSLGPRGHSPDGKLLVTGMEPQVSLWNTTSGKQHGPMLRHTQQVQSAAFSPDGKRLLTGGGAYDVGLVHLWDTETGKLIGEPLRMNIPVARVQISPTGKTFIAGLSMQGTLVGTLEGGPRRTHTLPLAVSGPACFLPGGDTFLMGKGDQIRRFNAATGEETGIALDNVGGVGKLVLSQDGKRVLTVSGGGTARVWDLEKGRPIGKPLTHPDAVTVICFSPDGNRVVTGCQDKMARVWDVATSRPLGPPLPHSGWLRCAAVHPDGKLIGTGGDDKVAQFWTLPEATADKPERLRLWVEVLTGRELDSNGAVRVLDAPAWHERRGKLGVFAAP